MELRGARRDETEEHERLVQHGCRVVGKEVAVAIGPSICTDDMVEYRYVVEPEVADALHELADLAGVDADLVLRQLNADVHHSPSYGTSVQITMTTAPIKRPRSYVL